MSTDEIANTVALLKVTTIQEALKQSGSKAYQATGTTKTAKPDLIKLYERQVMDVGIEKFISRINESLVTQTATLLGVEAKKPVLTTTIQETGIVPFLSKASYGMLTSFTFFCP